jgi:menaquinone-dependent protoporphyrinogen oxidase
MEGARHFAQRHHEALQRLPVWLFASGPIGESLQPTEESPDGLRIARDLAARNHQTFAGRIDPDGLSWVERTITRMVKAPDGDYRDWEAIRAFGDEIAASLKAEEVPA